MKPRYLGTASVAALIGCATQIPVESDTAPAVENDTVDGQQTIYSVNADGTWSATAWTPEGNSTSFVYGGGTFGGPSGKTRRMGPCLLRLYQTDEWDPGHRCETVADCTSSPTNLPQGGFRYCAAPDGAKKYCFYRPGPPTSYCSGTPALGGAQVAPGNYWTPLVYTPPSGSKWISYACFEGCTASDPSSSSAAKMVIPPVCGDGTCESPDEDAYNCGEDCGFCGDGICSSSESDCTCQQDCGYNPNCH